MLDIHQIQPIAQRHRGHPVHTEVRDGVIHLLLIFPDDADRDAFLTATREASPFVQSFPLPVTVIIDGGGQMAVEIPIGPGAEVFAPPPAEDEDRALWEALPYAAGTRVQVSPLMARYLTTSELLTAAACARLDGMPAQVAVYAGELLRRVTHAEPDTTTAA